MSIVWPDSLPRFLLEGYSHSGEDGVLRTQMDGGRRVRPRFTAAPYEQVAAQVMCTRAQLQTLLDFYAITLRRVLPFNHVDETKGGTAAVYAFAARPSYQPAGSGFLFRVSLQLELISTTPGAFPLTDGAAVLVTETDEDLTT